MHSVEPDALVVPALHAPQLAAFAAALNRPAAHVTQMLVTLLPVPFTLTASWARYEPGSHSGVGAGVGGVGGAVGAAVTRAHVCGSAALSQ